MDKVLVILPDNNKGKYLAKAYSSAFSELSFFVIERKIFDLSIEDIQKINPSIVFTFWSDMKNNDSLIEFFSSLDLKDTVFINCAELMSDIPKVFHKKTYCFTVDSEKQKYKFLLAVNPKEYKSKFKGYKYSITFAGNPAYLNREKILATLVKNFGPINIFARSYDFYKSVDEIFSVGLLDEEYLELYRSSYRGYVESQKELSNIFVSSKINIDMLNPNKSNINYRFFEILASGGFLLSHYDECSLYNFEEGKDFETYDNEIDLVDKVNFYLKNANISQSIAYNGRKHVASNHSFYGRLKKMLKVIYGEDFSNR